METPSNPVPQLPTFEDQTVLDLAPETFRDALATVNPKAFEWSEEQLQMNAKPCRVLKLLRLRFWEEAYEAIQDQRRMKMENITRGLCNSEALRPLLRAPTKVAYIWRQPVRYDLLQRNIFITGLNRLEHFITKGSFYDRKTTTKKLKDGTETTTVEEKINMQVVKGIHSIVESMGNRIQGTLVQRLHQHVTGIPQSAQDAHILKTKKADPMEFIEAELYEIERAEGKRPSPNPPE